MKQEDIDFIKDKIRDISERNGYDLTDKLDEIAKAKCMFFGVKKWMKCPCDPESDRACISKHCKEDIAKDGICHCGLHKKKEIDDRK